MEENSKKVESFKDFLKSESSYVDVDLSRGEDRTLEIKYVDGKVVGYFVHERWDKTVPLKRIGRYVR